MLVLSFAIQSTAAKTTDIANFKNWSENDTFYRKILRSSTPFTDKTFPPT